MCRENRHVVKSDMCRKNLHVAKIYMSQNPTCRKIRHTHAHAHTYAHMCTRAYAGKKLWAKNFFDLLFQGGKIIFVYAHRGEDLLILGQLHMNKKSKNFPLFYSNVLQLLQL